ncbi:hypothetical protein DFH28DRAFT_64480 [Melampsora americana]|nr:hypothetical protein DFH28DRAFT_64480 [Melampsora americana]
MSSSSSTNETVSSNTFGLLSPFVCPAPSGSSIGQDISARKQNRDGRYPVGPCSYVSKVGIVSTSLQSPFSSPVSTRACETSASPRRLVELSSELTQRYSTPVRYHLPTRMRAIPKPEISCFESDDEDQVDRLSVKKALTMASDALAWCTRRRANSLVTLKAFKHTDNKVQSHEVTEDTNPKMQKFIADQQWTMGRDPQSQSHKVQWSGSTLNSVSEAYPSLVPMCRQTRESTNLKRFGPDTDFGKSGGKEARLEGRPSNSQWIGWHGPNPFEIEEASRVSKLRSPGPPPTCPLPPLPTKSPL